MKRSWGLELEFGDVRRDLIIPKELGSWNYTERDIVNQREPYWGIAADPLGIDPPVGGEINTIPTDDYREQIVIFEKLKQFFIDHDCPPTASCVSNTHVHLRIPGLRNDLFLLKRFFKETYRRQDRFVRKVYGIGPQRHPYINDDSGRKYSEEASMAIMNAKTCPEFFSRCVYNPKKATERYLVNFMSLVKNDTLEFRFFRCTTETKHIEGILSFCNLFVENVVNNVPMSYDYDFPKLEYDEELFNSWIKTRKRD